MTDLIYRKAADLADKSEDPKLRAVAERLDLTVAALYREVSQLKNRLALIEEVKKSCAWENTASINIPTGTSYVALTWDTVLWDNDDMTDYGSDRIQINTPGYYLISGSVRWDPTGLPSMTCFMKFELNGTTDVHYNKRLVNSLSVVANIHAILKLAKNDYVRFLVRHSSVADESVDDGGDTKSLSFKAAMIERIYNPDDIPNRYE